MKTTMIWLIGGILLLPQCKKYVEVPSPNNAVTGESVYKAEATATAVLTGLYMNISASNLGTPDRLAYLGFFAGLSADELTLWPAVTDYLGLAYYRNELRSAQNISAGGEFWSTLYKYIAVCNAAIAGLEASNLIPQVKDQLLGEAKFMRAFCYFYLVNLYNKVPLPLSTDYKATLALRQVEPAAVYDQVIRDGLAADSSLATYYPDANLAIESAYRVRPNKAVAKAFLARVYLYTSQWQKAEESASFLIGDARFQLETDLNNVFLNTSKEAIWQLQPVVNGNNTEEANNYLLTETGPTELFTGQPVYLNRDLVRAFEDTDQRKKSWIDSVIVSTDTFYYPYKYKIRTGSTDVIEYLTPLRLAEQYLIRAEARLRLGNTETALSDLNTIRNRAGLAPLTSTDTDTILQDILKQRRLELFTEWGHRWLDLKRTGEIDEVMLQATPGKGGVWSSNWQWYPIPFNDLFNAPQLVQNQGY